MLMTRVHALEIEEATTMAALEALRPDWTKLWLRSPAATPFQSPAWLIPWWRHFGNDELLVLAARRARTGGISVSSERCGRNRRV